MLWAWSSALLASTAGALAQAAPRVLVVDTTASPAGSDVAERVRSELRTEGFDVASPGENTETPAVATIRLENEAELFTVDVELASARPQDGETRRFHGEAAEGRILALRVVEYVLASQVDVRKDVAPPATPAVVAKPATIPAEATTPPPRSHRVKLELGAMLWAGTVGERPALGAAVAGAYGLFDERLWLELRLSGFATGRLESEGGSADLRHSLATLGARWHVVDGARVGMFAALSGGAYVLQASGSSTSDWVASDEAAAIAAGTVGGGAFARLDENGSFRVVTRLEALFTAQRPKIEFGPQTVDTMARATLLASLGVEAYF